MTSASRTNHDRPGFSLIELVIVVVIIGIIGAVAVPRMSRGSEGAAISALAADLDRLNKAVDLYAAEHDGDFPRLADIHDQLIGKTDNLGDAWSGLPNEIAYGPYLQTISPLPLGFRKGCSKIAASDGDGVGWLYAPTRGIIRPNLTKQDGSVDETTVTSVIVATNLKRDDLVP